ncbi:RNA polymerase I-specific transcription initiation factor RRN3 [Infundibulicybe gibba]|nr:RNA polymerase I-specific transcription initiation factor RRN3 [Infundibulicybe gibba]
MDPHSRRSQFNQRVPKLGPASPNSRFMDIQSKPSLDTFTKSGSESKPKPKSEPPTTLLLRRPIATNSRIKQGEQYRKDMYLSFVNDALEQKAKGSGEPFDELVSQFNPKKSRDGSSAQSAQLRFWILALCHVVSRLERHHSALVEAIVNLPWTTLDNATVKSYTVFMGMLISARPEYLSLVLGKIAQGFTHQSMLQVLDAGLPETSTSPLTRRVIYDRLHYLLRHLISLIPTLSSTLQPLLVRNFPHKRQNQAAQTTYIRNILRVSSYCPELADKILATIIDRAIQIDVEIQVELEELEELETGQDQDLFEVDPFDTLVGEDIDDSDSDNDSDADEDHLSDISSDGEDFDDDVQVPETPTNTQHIQDMVNKLDAILTLIFDHFKRANTPISSAPLTPKSPSSSYFDSTPDTPLDSNSPSLTPYPQPATQSTKSHTRLRFHALLSIFDRTILRTFKSRYTQFLIFWYTSLDPEFADIFQGMLVDRALFSREGETHNSTPLVTRAAAASYIGSFVSRAVFVDREGARRVVGVLCEFLRAHLDGVEETIRAGGTLSGIQNGVFYAVTQAVFLIFCFRWRDLLEEEGGDEELLIGNVQKGSRKWMPQLSTVCSPNVVSQFARVAHTTDFIYCYTILESNKRSDYGSNNAEGRTTPRNNMHIAASERSVTSELNTFFPFDPYRLPRSNIYIQGIYREWSSVAIDDDEDSDDSDEEQEEGTELHDESISSSTYLDIPQSSSREKVDNADGLGESLGAMSISPIHTLIRPVP